MKELMNKINNWKVELDNLGEAYKEASQKLEYNNGTYIQGVLNSRREELSKQIKEAKKELKEAQGEISEVFKGDVFDNVIFSETYRIDKVEDGKVYYTKSDKLNTYSKEMDLDKFIHFVNSEYLVLTYHNEDKYIAIDTNGGMRYYIVSNLDEDVKDIQETLIKGGLKIFDIMEISEEEYVRVGGRV